MMSPTAKMCGCWCDSGHRPGCGRASRLRAGGGEVQVVDVALAAHGVEQRVAGNFLLAFENGGHAVFRGFFHALDFFVEAHGDAAVAQVIAERLDNLGVGELQQARPLFDQRDANAQDGEHAGIFHADHSAADDDQGLRNLRHAENLVAINDGAVIEGHQRGRGGLGPRGDDDVGGFVRRIGCASRPRGCGTDRESWRSR